jgi:hypothetical protein
VAECGPGGVRRAVRPSAAWRNEARGAAQPSETYGVFLVFHATFHA